LNHLIIKLDFLGHFFFAKMLFLIKSFLILISLTNLFIIRLKKLIFLFLVTTMQIYLLVAKDVHWTFCQIAHIYFAMKRFPILVVNFHLKLFLIINSINLHTHQISSPYL